MTKLEKLAVEKFNEFLKVAEEHTIFDIIIVVNGTVTSQVNNMIEEASEGGLINIQLFKL